MFKSSKYRMVVSDTIERRICLDLVPRIMTVSDHEPIVWRVWVVLVPGAVAARQSPKCHPEVLTDERVYKRIDCRIYPTCVRGTTKKKKEV